jgi:hypothetical protein
VLDRDDRTNEALVAIHWNGERHTELRVSRVRTGHALIGFLAIEIDRAFLIGRCERH